MSSINMNHKKATTNHLYSIWYSTIIDFLYIYYSMFAQMVNQCSLSWNHISLISIFIWDMNVYFLVFFWTPYKFRGPLWDELFFCFLKSMNLYNLPIPLHWHVFRFFITLTNHLSIFTLRFFLLEVTFNEMVNYI